MASDLRVKQQLYTFHYTWQHSSCDIAASVSLTQGAPTGSAQLSQLTRLPCKAHLQRTRVLHSQARGVINNVNNIYLFIYLFIFIIFFFFNNLTPSQIRLVTPERSN